MEAWAAIGMSDGGVYRGAHVPLLDLFGENDPQGVLKTTTQRVAALAEETGSIQINAPTIDISFPARKTRR